jgi:hypothetical protein
MPNSHNVVLRSAKGKRKLSGYSIIEMPLAMWLIFIGLLFPLAVVGSLGYRATLLYYGSEQACRKAAKAATFTDAQAKASSAMTTFLGAFTGIDVTSNKVGILRKPLTAGAPTYYSAKLAAGTVDTSKDIFFVVIDIDANLAPLVQCGNWMGIDIPGLSSPYTLRIRQQAYFENPTGLTE